MATDLMSTLGAQGPSGGARQGPRPRRRTETPALKVSDVDETGAWSVRHGTKAVFFGTMIQIFRSLISIPAGVERTPMGSFLARTALGSLIWSAALIMAGYLLGVTWHVVESHVGVLGDHRRQPSATP